MALDHVTFFPALILGIIIGFIELLFIHADQNFRGSHWIGHALHATGFSFLFIFISMNIDYVLGLVNLSFPYQDIVVRGLVAIVAFIKISGAAAGAGKVVREKMVHIIVVVALITAAPFLWDFLQPVCEGLIDKAFC